MVYMAKNASNLHLNKIYTVTCTDGALVGRVVGDALDAGRRANQYTSKTSTVSTVFNFNLPIPGRRDYEVHTLLKHDPKIVWDGGKKVGHWRTREAFYMKDPLGDPSYIDECVSRWASGNLDTYRRELAYKPYARQAEAIAWAVTTLQSFPRLLIEAAPRFGKSYVALDIARQMGAKTVLILTPFPDADGSFREVVMFHKDFPDAKFEDVRQDDDLDLTIDYPGMRVVMASWQYLEEDKDSCQSIFEDGVDFVIVDETHRASDTIRSEGYLDLIPHKYEVHLSGTPYNDKLVGRFVKSNTWTYDFIDRLSEAAAARALPTPDNRFLASTPSMSLFLIDQMEQVVEECKAKYPDFTVEEGLTLEKFFTEKYRFLVKIFFRNLATTLDDPLAVRLINSPELEDTMSHILLFVPNRIAADLINQVLKELQGEKGGWAGYSITSVSGVDETESFTSVEKFINTEMDKTERTITISVGKATTGVTLPKLTSVWILRKMSSAEQFVQVILRSGTPFKGKVKSSILCFDSESLLVAQAVVASQRSRNTAEPIAQVMATMYRCLPTLVWSPDLKFQEIDAVLALSETKKILMKNAGLDFEFEIPNSALFNELLEADLPEKEIAKIRMELGLGGQKGAKNKKAQKKGAPKNADEQDEEEVVDPDELKVRIRAVLNWMDHIVLGDDVREVAEVLALPEARVQEVLHVSLPQLKAIFDLVTFALVQQWIDTIRIKFNLN
jgi:superfamily II DNA or RNA helicase